MDLLAFAGVAVDPPPRPEARPQDSNGYKDSNDSFSSRQKDDDRSSFENALKKSETDNNTAPAETRKTQQKNTGSQSKAEDAGSSSDDAPTQLALFTQEVALTPEDQAVAPEAELTLNAESADADEGAAFGALDEALTETETPLVAPIPADKAATAEDNAITKSKNADAEAELTDDALLAQRRQTAVTAGDQNANAVRTAADKNTAALNAKQPETDPTKQRAENAGDEIASDRRSDQELQNILRNRSTTTSGSANAQASALGVDPALKVATSEGANIPFTPIADDGLNFELRQTSARMPVEFQTALTANAQNDAARQVVAAIKTLGTQSTIDVQLDPPELGRVRISFQVERADVITAVVSADRGDTLDIMRRNAEELTRTLARAGFTDVNLSFESGNGQDGQSFEEQTAASFGDALPEGQDAAPVAYVSLRTDKVLNRLV